MSYRATAKRDGLWWSIEITDGLPDTMATFTQARRLTEVDAMARSAIADLLELNPAHIEVELTIMMPDALESATAALAEAEERAEDERLRAVLSRQHLAHLALEEGLTMREAGMLLAVSHQRIKQLNDGYMKLMDLTP